MLRCLRDPLSCVYVREPKQKAAKFSDASHTPPHPRGGAPRGWR